MERSFGSLIQSVRKSSGIPVDTLLKKLNRTQGWLSKVENDKDGTKVTKEDLKVFMHELDIPPDELLGVSSNDDETIKLFLKIDKETFEKFQSAIEEVDSLLSVMNTSEDSTHQNPKILARLYMKSFLSKLTYLPSIELDKYIKRF